MVEELRERLKVGRVNKSSAVSEEKRGGGGWGGEEKGKQRSTYLGRVGWACSQDVGGHNTRHVVSLLFLQDSTSIVFTHVFITCKTPVGWPLPGGNGVLVDLKMGKEVKKRLRTREGKKKERKKLVSEGVPRSVNG